MRERRADRERQRTQEFEDFAAGSAARLLRTAELLAGDRAAPLLTMALARTYAEWDGLRGDDPYDRARRILVVRFAYGAWYRAYGGPLSLLSARERLVLVLWLHEGLAPGQTAAVLGMAEERVRAVCARAVGTMRAGVRSTTAAGAYGVDGGDRPDRPDLPDRRTREVARMLKGPHPRVPADLVARAAERGARLLRRRRALNRLFICVLWAAVTAFAVWAAVSHPWLARPADTTPPLDGW